MLLDIAWVRANFLERLTNDCSLFYFLHFLGVTTSVPAVFRRAYILEGDKYTNCLGSLRSSLTVYTGWIQAVIGT